VKETASTSVDTIHKNVSKMSYALLQGSGVMVNSKNEIMGNNKTFQTELENVLNQGYCLDFGGQ